MDRRIDFTRHFPCRIVIDGGAETRLPALVAPLASDGAMVLHDARVAEIASRISHALGARARIPIEGGESAKRLTQLGELASKLRDHGATRRTALVAVGGGSITDLVGFLAATYQRGVPCVLCPTTTLAMCDAAIGGKNGVDHHGLKNLLGVIRQPDLIVADPQWLTSLPDAAYREGLVEVIKKAAVLDAACFERLEALAPALLARDIDAIRETVELAVRMKLEVVEADETESDRRRWLNFGHTLGHALESVSEERITHGRAVAIGMLLECRAAGTPTAVTDRLARWLAELRVDARLPAEYADATALWSFAKRDKKATNTRVPMIVPRALGHGHVVDLTEAALASVLES